MPNTSIKHWQDPLNLILGIWMVVSPWARQYQTDMHLTLNAMKSNAATSNAVILGILIAAAALIALFRVMAWEEWVNVVLGMWLVISPWALGFNALATVTRRNALRLPTRAAAPPSAGRWLAGVSSRTNPERRLFRRLQKNFRARPLALTSRSA